MKEVNSSVASGTAAHLVRPYSVEKGRNLKIFE